ncbi:Oxidoreductase ptaL [Colletotrichum orbiculare MAFF 240422]|uniref:Oxidoreductase ptaL n=1 Tax=Colletotrichum orbiculare (strain 104-T / ATCC 96160 / CBS 514.97 / LARS 414 / MAFF 240422) TaxID=1213857 RepID=N4VI58_COLOR|nr:Oxidoreductase ptaL [Colletotrichum orbiculare MAFF 240422]
MVKTVVVLGAAYGGLAVAHRLLKYTRQQEDDLRVILVSKTTHFYWNMASVRAIVPGILRDEQIFMPIEAGFEQYPKESFEFVLGTATGLDVARKSALVSTSSGPRSLPYDYLVLATGARSASLDMPWKGADSHEKTLDLLHSTAEKVKKAKHIIVAGAGPTGVETAAEIRFEYKDKEVVLLAADDEIFGGDSAAKGAENEITRLGVRVKKSARVANTRTLPDGQTEVSLINGEKLKTDLYLPTMGLIPNSEFLDASLLNDKKYANVDEYMRVRGVDNIWACGDLVSYPRAGFMITDKQAAGVVKNIELAIKGKDQQVVKGMPVDIFVCATGRSRGAGRVGWAKVPSLFVWAVKGRTLGTDYTPKYVNGSQW